MNRRDINHSSRCALVTASWTLSYCSHYTVMEKCNIAVPWIIISYGPRWGSDSFDRDGPGMFGFRRPVPARHCRFTGNKGAECYFENNYSWRNGPAEMSPEPRAELFFGMINFKAGGYCRFFRFPALGGCRGAFHRTQKAVLPLPYCNSLRFSSHLLSASGPAGPGPVNGERS